MGLRDPSSPLGKDVSMITFQKSFAAALLTGAVAFATPVLLHAQTTTKTNGSATTSGQVQAPASNAAGNAAGANAAGAASTSSGQNLTPNSTNATTGAYGGMSTDQSTNDANKAEKKATSHDVFAEQHVFAGHDYATALAASNSKLSRPGDRQVRPFLFGRRRARG